MADLDDLFAGLWAQYVRLNPDAETIHQLLATRGEDIVNDHVAFRTFSDDRLGIDRIAAPFLALGYEPKDTYRFEEKKLFARYYAHEDPSQPKVFVSELLLHECSSKLQKTVSGLIEQLNPTECEGPEMLTSGRRWSLDAATYEALYQESEYAGWMAAFGFCANHFTVFVNALKTVPNIEELADLLIRQGFTMNEAGGLIKGSTDVYLKQCSTMAARIEVPFTDGPTTIPSCYYEFAERYPLADGQLYQGFVAASADKIFESTHR